MKTAWAGRRFNHPSINRQRKTARRKALGDRRLPIVWPVSGGSWDTQASLSFDLQGRTQTPPFRNDMQISSKGSSWLSPTVEQIRTPTATTVDDG